MGAALQIIEREGVEALSLREVARRLGVSHQAPYKHYESRDHILAEVVARAFAEFGAHLDARARGATAQEDLASLGRAYLAYASAHPLQYRLMFGTALPDPAQHPAMMREARHAFSLLREGLARTAAERGVRLEGDALDRDALFVWATMHGLASIRPSCALDTLGLGAEVLASAVPHTLSHVSTALAVSLAQAPQEGGASPRRIEHARSAGPPDRPPAPRRRRTRERPAQDDDG